MKRKWKDERGVIAIDAVIGLTMFMATVFTLMFMSLIVRVQGTVQYALDQTAKEISGYFYLLDKTGVTKIISGPDRKSAKDVDAAIGSVLDFTDQAKDFGESVADVDLSNLPEHPMEEIGKVDPAEAKKLWESAKGAVDSLKTVADNPGGNIRAVLSIFAKSFINKGVSFYVAPAVCRAIMPKYISGSRDDTNSALEALGLKGGLDEIDFTQSQLLLDGRSVKLVAIYRLNTKKVTFGLVDSYMYFRVVASTAAWVAPDEKNTKSFAKLGITTPAPAGTTPTTTTTTK